jgi:molecular chaperone GrpE
MKDETPHSGGPETVNPAGGEPSQEQDLRQSEEVQTPPEGAAADETARGEELQAKLDEALKNAEGFKDQLLRKAAEFENYKRRTEAESLFLIRNANEGLLLALIPVVEDFARSLKSGQEQGETGALLKGVELIYQKLVRVLELQGLVPFESVGKPFDVNFHDALLVVPRAEVVPGTVIEEVERGYRFHDRVLRHAKVIVSSAVETTEGTPGTGASKESIEE